MTTNRREAAPLDAQLVEHSGLVGCAVRRRVGGPDDASLIRAFQAQELWPPVVPTMALVESLYGDPRRDANTHRFLKMCIIETSVGESTARRAAELRRLARAGSAVDALVVALAESGGTVLTGGRADIEALAAHADRVAVEVV